MSTGKARKKYTGEFKLKVVEQMRMEHLSYRETAVLFEICNHHEVQKWERIYLEEGAEGLKIERRGRGAKEGQGRPRQLDKKVEEDLITENQRLRMENDYLKKLNALVQEKQLRETKPR